jgi:hypothetical protein
MENNHIEQITTEELNVLVENKFANSINVVHHAYIDISGDLLAGTLLGQILYWFSPDKNGRPRVRVKKDGYYWLAKDRSDWFDEIRISPKQYDRAAKLLEDKKLIIKSKYKFKGMPMIHIRPNYTILNNAINAWKLEVKHELLEGGKRELTDGENGEESRGLSNQQFAEPLETVGIDQRGIRELPKGENGNLPKGNSGIDQRGIPLTEITTESTNRYHNHQSEIEQAQLEVAATQEKDVVVDVKTLIANVFKTEINNQQSKRLIAQATKHGKNLEGVVQQTKEHFLSTNEPINDLVASLMHGINVGWDKPKSVVVATMPNAISKKTEQPITDEDLTDIYDDIKATMELLRSTEGQVLDQS